MSQLPTEYTDSRGKTYPIGDREAFNDSHLVNALRRRRREAALTDDAEKRAQLLPLTDALDAEAKRRGL